MNLPQRFCLGFMLLTLFSMLMFLIPEGTNKLLALGWFAMFIGSWLAFIMSGREE